MALLKEIELPSGVIVNYHRIVNISKITNNKVIVEVSSYTSQKKREEEIEKLAAREGMNIFIETDFINVDYDEDKTIKDYYNYLKTTEKYSGAEDI